MKFKVSGRRALAKRTSVLAAAAIFTMECSLASGQTTNWIGGTSSDWAAASNWNVGVPNSTTNATFTGGYSQRQLVTCSTNVANCATLTNSGIQQIQFGTNTLAVQGDYNIYPQPSAGPAQLSLQTGQVAVAGNVNVGGTSSGSIGLASLEIDSGATCSANTTNIYTGSKLSLKGGTLITQVLNDGNNPKLLNWSSGTLDIAGSAPFFIQPGTPLGNNVSLASGQIFDLPNAQYVSEFGNVNVLTGAQLNCSNYLVGNGGYAQLSINGGSMNASGVTIVGNGLPWAGSLSINNGGSLSTSTFYDGLVSSSENDVTVSDAGSSLTASSIIYVGSGNSGSATLGVSYGAMVQTSSSNSYISVGSGGGNGLITLGYLGTSDSGASLSSAGGIYVGGDSTAYTNSMGSGVINAYSGTSLTTSGVLKIWNSNASAVNLLGGTINAGSLDTSGVPNRFDWTFGTLNLTNSGLTLTSNGVLGATLSLNPGMALNTSGGVTITKTGTLNFYGGTVSGPVNLSGGNINAVVIQTAGNINWTSGTLTISSSRLAIGNNPPKTVQANNAARAWGATGYGTLGNGTNAGSNVPVSVTNLSSSVTAIAGGAFHGLAIQNGGVFAWGSNVYGALGNGTTTDSNVPVAVTGLSSGVTAIAGGSDHSLAIQNGGVFAWGYNPVGELGNGTTTNSNVPVAVTGLSSGVTAIAGGLYHSLAIQNGGVFAWGYNLDGELGNGTPTNSNVPVAVTGLSSGVTAIAGGGYHSLAIQNGGVFAWGYNGYGELGNGTTTNSNLPVAVTSLSSGVTAIAGGLDHSLAIQNGIVYAWGSNDAGALGNGTNTFSNVPVAVRGISGTVVEVAAGVGDSFALSSDGTIWDWGLNYEGQLGLGTTTRYYTTPQHLLAPAGYAFTSISTESYSDFAVATLAPLVSSSLGSTLTINPLMSLQVPGAGQSIDLIPGGVLTLAGGSILTPTLNVSGGTFNWTSGSLHLTGGGSTFGGPLSIPTAGQLIVDGTVDLPGANVTLTINQLRQGYTNGTWSGTNGITSALAATDSNHLTTLGIIQNSTNQNASGPVLYTSLDGYTAMAASDVLIKYTYYGDANLDGKVDGSDYSRIDSGFLMHLTSWYNGDFNYDGVVDGSDYTLIDNAFNTQGAQLTTENAQSIASITAELADTSAVPEPASIGFFSLASAGLLGRRSRD